LQLPLPFAISCSSSLSISICQVRFCFLASVLLVLAYFSCAPGLLISGVGLSVECVLAPRSVCRLDCSCRCLLQACLQVVQFCRLGVKLLAPIFIAVRFLHRVRLQASTLCLICFGLDFCRRWVRLVAGCAFRFRFASCWSAPRCLHGLSSPIRLLFSCLAQCVASVQPDQARVALFYSDCSRSLYSKFIF
jgi:hypothetical protein